MFSSTAALKSHLNVHADAGDGVDAQQGASDPAGGDASSGAAHGGSTATGTLPVGTNGGMGTAPTIVAPATKRRRASTASSGGAGGEGKRARRRSRGGSIGASGEGIIGTDRWLDDILGPGAGGDMLPDVGVMRGAEAWNGGEGRSAGEGDGGAGGAGADGRNAGTADDDRVGSALDELVSDEDTRGRAGEQSWAAAKSALSPPSLHPAVSDSSLPPDTLLLGSGVETAPTSAVVAPSPVVRPPEGFRASEDAVPALQALLARRATSGASSVFGNRWRFNAAGNGAGSGTSGSHAEADE